MCTYSVDKEFHRTHPRKCLTSPSRHDVDAKSGFMFSLLRIWATSIPLSPCLHVAGVSSLTSDLGKGNEHMWIGRFCLSISIIGFSYKSAEPSLLELFLISRPTEVVYSGLLQPHDKLSAEAESLQFWGAEVNLSTKY